MKRNQQMAIFLILLFGSTLQFKLSSYDTPKDSLDSDKLNDSPKNDNNEEQNDNSATPENSNHASSDDSLNEVDSSNTENLQEGNLKTSDSSTQKSRIYNKETQWNDYGNGSINFLDRHYVYCSDRNTALNSFRYEHKDERRQKKNFFGFTEYYTATSLRFSYTCVESPEISEKCNTMTTQIQDANFIVEKSLNALVKHNVSCPQNTVMKGFVLRPRGKYDMGFGALLRLDPKDRPQLSYEYTCCDANISRTIYAQTGPTWAGDNEYYNLRNQFINAKDFNAISSFNMQVSQNDIYYSMKFSTLKGETSPSFPDPCIGSSQGSNPSFLGNLISIKFLILI